MTPSLKNLLIAGLLTFVAGIVLLFPARVAYHWFIPEGVQLGGIEGSIWTGSARDVTGGGVYLRDVRWRMRPLLLFTGKLGFGVEATPGSGLIEADIALGLGGNVTLTNLTGSASLNAFADVLKMPGLAGNVSLQFERIQFIDGLPVDVVGTVAVAGLVAPLIDSSSIGDYRMEFFTTENGVVASVEDSNGAFDLAGGLTISEDRNYVFLGKIAATDRTSGKLRQQLRFLGTPDERGQHEIRLEGSL